MEINYITTEDLEPVLDQIDSMYFNKIIDATQAEDMTRIVARLKGCVYSTGIIDVVVKSLQSLKIYMDEKAIIVVINCLRNQFK